MTRVIAVRNVTLFEGDARQAWKFFYRLAKMGYTVFLVGNKTIDPYGHKPFAYNNSKQMVSMPDRKLFQEGKVLREW